MDHSEFIAGISKCKDLGTWLASLSQKDMSTHIPEILALGGVSTKNGNVLDHTFAVCNIVSNRTTDLCTRVASIYHDSGKSITSQVPEYLRHDMDIQHQQWSEVIARERLIRWRFVRYDTTKILTMIRTHMLDINPDAGDASVRKFIATIRPENIDHWFILRLADSLAYGVDGCQNRINDFKSRVMRLLNHNSKISMDDLAISLDDLTEEYGSCDKKTLQVTLEKLLEGVQSFTYANTRQVLMNLAGDILLLGV